jgi:hypothetical protein
MPALREADVRQISLYSRGIPNILRFTELALFCEDWML